MTTMKEFKNMLRNKLCKPRLSQWLIEAELTEEDRELLYKVYYRGQSQARVAMDTYQHEVTIGRHINKALNKLLDYLDYKNSLA